MPSTKAPARATTSRPTRTSAIAQLPPIASFLTTLSTTAETCSALLAVKGPAAKIIPVGIRAQMRTMATINTYWGANKAAYNALLEASQAAAPVKPASRAQRAGA